MRLSNFHFGRLAALTGFLTSAAIGCVITVGDGGKAADGGSCPDTNSFIKEGECFCDVGYDWCNENDNTDLTCCENPTTGNTNSTNNPTNNPSDPTNGTTEDVPTSGTSDTTTDIPTSGTTDAPGECVVDTAPPPTCSANEAFLCIQASNPACGTEGSKFYLCTNGVWVEDSATPEADCKISGYDFSVGCLDDGEKVVFDCGVGPGTPCQTGSDPSCNGETIFEECYQGKLTATDCEAYCMEVGDEMMVTYDYGYCGEQRSEIVCICCDEGDEGCPINGGTTGGDTTTDGGTTSGDTTGG